MKKVLFFLTALFTISFAQAQSGLKLGLKAGANLSNWSGDDVKEFESSIEANLESKFGFHVGGFVDYGISEMVSIRPEVLFSMKGWKAEEGGSTLKVKTNYIDVPVLARINAGGIFFELGPTFSFNVSSKVTGEDGGDEATVDFEDAFGFKTKSFDFGYAAGLGYELPMGIGINLRYNGGISNIIDSDEDVKIKNSVFQLGLSYTLVGKE